MTPATPAAGTASAGWLGSARAQKLRGTKTAMTAESTTPKTRNGTACTSTETNTVDQVCSAAPEISPAMLPRASTSSTSTTASTSREPIVVPFSSAPGDFFSGRVVVGAVIGGSSPSSSGRVRTYPLPAAKPARPTARMTM